MKARDAFEMALINHIIYAKFQKQPAENSNF